MQHLEALNKLNAMAFTFYTAGAFSAACNLKIFDALVQPQSAAQLAQAVGIHPEGARRLLSAMENLALVSLGEQGYQNTALAGYLVTDADYPMAFHQHDCYFYRMWEYLPDALREYSPRHEQAWGQSAQELYKAIYGNETQMRHFFRLLDSYNGPIGELAAEKLALDRFHRVLDLAGGTGTFAAELVQRHAHLSGVCLDLAPVQPLSEEMIARRQLANRFEFVVGDMFAGNYPSDVDVILLSYILHNWDDEGCLTILRHCYDALPTGGMLVVSEKVLNNDHTGDWWGVMMNLQMLIAFQPGAKERTHAEYNELLASAGFTDMQLLKLDAPRDLLVAYKS